MIENLVLGSGPVGIAVATSLSNAGREVLVVDSGEGLPALRAATTVNSNIDYRTVRQAPSIVGGSSFPWGGACMSYPEADLQSTKNDLLPLDGLESAYKLVSQMFDVRDFDFRNNLPTSSHSSGAFNPKHGLLDVVYAYVVKDPMMKGSLHTLRSNSGVKFLTNVITTDLIDRGDYVSTKILKYDSNEDFDIQAKRVFVCLGAIETTRILMSSTGVGQSGNAEELGRNLSDHLGFKIGSVSFESLKRWAPIVDYQVKLDGSRLWPRWRIHNQPTKFESLRGFLYFSNTRKVNSKFCADLNLFIEVPNSSNRWIELAATRSHLARIPEIRISFDVSDGEWQEISEFKDWILDQVNETQGVESVFADDCFSKENLQTTNHPSGTHPLSIQSLPNVFPLSAGLLPRASATHPTLVTMALAVATVNRLLG